MELNSGYTHLPIPSSQELQVQAEYLLAFPLYTAAQGLKTVIRAQLLTRIICLSRFEKLERKKKQDILN